MPSDQQRSYEKLPLSNASHPNNQWAHKEALRVAIGSILAPKRPPYSPGSRSASGTASPYSFPSSQSNSPGTGTPIHQTPALAATPFGGAPSGEYLHPHHALIPSHNHHHHPHHHHHHPYNHHHYHPHTHTPSKLAHSVAPSPDGSGSPVEHQAAVRLVSEPVVSIQGHNENLAASAIAPLPPPVPTESQAVVPARPALAPLQASTGVNGRAATMPEVQTISSTADKVTGGPGTGHRSPKSKFVEKLQSKSAWDALIHGSFS